MEDATPAHAGIDCDDMAGVVVLNDLNAASWEAIIAAVCRASDSSHSCWDMLDANFVYSFSIIPLMVCHGMVFCFCRCFVVVVGCRIFLHRLMPLGSMTLNEIVWQYFLWM